MYEAIKPVGYEKKILKALEDPEKRSLIFDALKLGKLQNSHKARFLVKIVDKKVALKILVSKGIDEALKFVKGRSKDGDSTMKTFEVCVKSMKRHNLKFRKRLLGMNDSDECIITEFVSEFREAMKDTDNEDLLREMYRAILRLLNSFTPNQLYFSR